MGRSFEGGAYLSFPKSWSIPQKSPKDAGSLEELPNTSPLVRVGLLNKAIRYKALIRGFIKMLNLTNRTWFSVVCTLIDNEYARHHSGENDVDSRRATE